MAKGFHGRTISFEPHERIAPSDSYPALLGALEAITRIAHEAPSVSLGLAQVLDTLCTAIAWPIGHVYQLAGDAALLTSAAIWHLEQPQQFVPFKQASEQTVFRPGRGLVGEVLARQRPGVSPDVTNDRRFLRRRAAAESGVKAWLAFPVVAGGRVVAVCECFATERVVLDPAVLGLLSCAGLALGQLYERERWQAERARLIAELAALEDAPARERAALAALAGAIAHEINSPLFAARTSLALLAADHPHEALIGVARADLTRIAAALETLHQLAQEAPLGQRLPQLPGSPRAQ